MTRIRILKNKAKITVNAELHSQFIENLGTNIYNGIWVGEDSEIPNYHGIRKDIVDALARISPPVLRWPGGCYADHYHWRHGVGDRSERPVDYNEVFGSNTLDYNQFGTHEFITLCHLVGSKPWININMLTGSPAEMVEWAEYCNRKELTTLTKEREANGSSEPFDVEYWGIGNESWAGGGTYTAAEYVAEYRKYSTAFPTFSNLLSPPSEHYPLKFIAVGPDGNKEKERVLWTKEFFSSISRFRQPKIDGYDLHFYNWNISDPTDNIVDFNEKQWFKVLSGALEIEDVVIEQYHLIKEGINNIAETEGPFQYKINCDLIIGEWGNWHSFSCDDGRVLWQQCTMRDAITTALTLDIFHRHSDKVKIACVAQTVNVLNSLFLTDGERTILTPNYHVFDMYKVHRGADLLVCQVETEMLSRENNKTVNAIYGFASIKENTINLNIINTDMFKQHTVLIEFDEPVAFADAKILKGESARSHNTFEAPHRVMPAAFDAIRMVSDGIWEMSVAPSSITVVSFSVCPQSNRRDDMVKNA